MPFFTPDNHNPGMRGTSAGPPPFQPPAQEWYEAPIVIVVVVVLTLAAIAATLAAVKAWERRASLKDKVIDGLALGLSSQRRAVEKSRSFWQQVKDRADQNKY
jgi:hypothetical protein